MDRTQHLAWCKQRAKEYTAKGDLKGGMASMVSDLRKHPDTAEHSGIMLGAMLLMGGQLETKQKMDEFIDGFN